MTIFANGRDDRFSMLRTADRQTNREVCSTKTTQNKEKRTMAGGGLNKAASSQQQPDDSSQPLTEQPARQGSHCTPAKHRHCIEASSYPACHIYGQTHSQNATG